MEIQKTIKTWIGIFNTNMFEKDMYDVSLPKYLEKDIEQLLDGINNNDNLLDCMLDELYGSINSAFWDGVISEKHAKHLREKYLVYRQADTNGE